jgi:hypothetical protein
LLIYTRDDTPTPQTKDPEDLSRIDVYDNGATGGEAMPLVIGRHVHPSG